MTLQMAPGLLKWATIDMALSSNPGTMRDYGCLISWFKRGLRTAGHGEGPGAVIFVLFFVLFLLTSREYEGPKSQRATNVLL